MLPVLLLLTLSTVRPDPALTPGATRAMTTAQICATAWAKDSRHVTVTMKKTVFMRYGVPWANRAQYEVDHLIPRELGGADLTANLWPEPLADAKRKDQQENTLHKAVCAGTMPLAAAQDVMRQWGR